jgi:CheY-like chemotaxis protein
MVCADPIFPDKGRHSVNTKILCVDDEPNILAAHQRQLRKQFEIDIAQGGEAGLEAIAMNGPYAVIVSDMRMPGMNGVQFLCRVQEVAPESVRIMLTGNADQQTAVEAVNQGNIFRFLTKPCPPDLLTKSLLAGIDQYRLITAEKELLENTLKGCVKVLSDVLGLVYPTAFGRASRLQVLVGKMAVALKVERAWEFELSAMLSQIGCVTIPETVLRKVYQGESLQPDEARMFAAHPRIGHELIASIPRLEAVAFAIASQEQYISESSDSAITAPEQEPTLGARVLRAAIEFDVLESKGLSKVQAFERLSEHPQRYGAGVLAALASTLEADHVFGVTEVSIEDLTPHMMLTEDLKTTSGLLLVGRGQEITPALCHRLKNYHRYGSLAKKSISVTTARVSIPT